MSRLNMVRKIKDSKTKVKDIYEAKREKNWDDRFIYNKLENNLEKRPLPKKAKNDYSSNIKYLKEQFNSDYLKKNTCKKTRGKSGYKININKNANNKQKPNSIFMFKNNNLLNNINKADEDSPLNLKLMNDKKKQIIGNNYNIKNDINIINDIGKYYLLSSKDLEIRMESLWNKLGIKTSYTNKFMKLKNDMNNEDQQKQFMILEIENLEKLEIFLVNLGQDIENREKIILIIEKLVGIIEKEYINVKEDIRNSILNDFFESLKKYRNYTVNVVENIDIFRNIFSNGINRGKFDEKILMRKYGLINEEINKQFKGNYLLKLRSDTNFLAKSKINEYKIININSISTDDPFLLSISDIIPINNEYIKRIKQCQYIIMQEIIYDSINSSSNNTSNFVNKSNNMSDISIKTYNKKPKEIKQSNNGNIDPYINNKYQKREKEKISCIDKNMKNFNDNRAKKNEGIIIEPQLQLIDKNNYENFFKKNDIEEPSDEQYLIELKNGLDNCNKNKKQKNNETFKNKTDILEDKENKDKNIEIKVDKSYEIKNMGNDIKEDGESIKEIEEKKDIENKNNTNENSKSKNEEQEEMKEINKEENKNKIEEKIENENNVIKEEQKINIQPYNIEEDNNSKQDENKIKESKNHINKEIEEENREDKIIVEVSKSKEIEENKVNIEEEIDQGKNNSDKDNNDDIVNIHDNNNINQRSIILNKDNNIENPLTNSKVNNLKSDKSRPMTPKSQNSSKVIHIKEKKSLEINKDNNGSINDINIHDKKNNIIMSFYTGKVSDFIARYSDYYKTIPEEQKIIFNLKENLIDYMHTNFYPKIITYIDKKTQIIKGLCIFSHILWKKNELKIEHISSYNEEERENIFELFLNFIKENADNIFGYDTNVKENDIYIDLYYKNEEGKFNINENIRDYIRKELKFKWVKLENLSKYVRYMKMRHHFVINNGNNIDMLNNEYDDNNILNHSIIGRKEFNEEQNDNNDIEEEESFDEDKNLNTSTVFDIYKENKEDMKNNINLYKNKNLNFLNNFIIKNKTVLKFNTKIYENKSDSNNNIKYSNPFNFVYLLNNVHNAGNNLYENISNNINYFFNQNNAEIIEQMLQKCFKIKNELLPENSTFYTDTTELNKLKNKFKINTNINILPLFENCISFIFNDYHYNRLQIPKLQTFIDLETTQLFFMISKNENQVVLISSSLNDRFMNKYVNNNNDNISINFMNIYNNLTNLNNIDNNILYIPAFEIKCKYLNNCYSKQEKNKKYNLYCYEDYYSVKFFSEEITKERNIKKNKKGKNKNININFEYDLIKDEYIKKQNFIKDNFLLIVIDLDLMEQLKDFPLMSLYVTKDNYIHV